MQTIKQYTSFEALKSDNLKDVGDSVKAAQELKRFIELLREAAVSKKNTISNCHKNEQFKSKQ